MAEPTRYLVTGPATEPVSLTEAKAHLRLETTDDDTYVTALITAARQYVEEACWRAVVEQTWEWVGEDFEDELLLEGGALKAISSVTYLDSDNASQTLASTYYDADTTRRPGYMRLAYDQDWPSVLGTWNSVRVRYVVGDGRYASGTITLSAGLAADESVSIAGHAFTAKAAGAVGDQFNLGATLADSATNLAAAISASATVGITGVVSATASGAVVTVTADSHGTDGNSITLSTASAHFAVSGATLSGGADVPEPIRQACLLLISQWYEHRTPEVIGTIVSEVRLAVDALLSKYSLKRF